MTLCTVYGWVRLLSDLVGLVCGFEWGKGDLAKISEKHTIYIWRIFLV